MIFLSDGLWNLLPAHRSCNSRKLARVGSGRMIQRLVERNGLFWGLYVCPKKKWVTPYADTVWTPENDFFRQLDPRQKRDSKG